MCAIADSGIFLGGSIGTASLEETFEGFALDDNSTSYRFYTGWQFNDYIAVEGGYLDLGTFRQSLQIDGMPVTALASADGFTLAAVGQWPISDRFSVQGRVGSFFWNGTAEINDFTSADPGDTNLFFGLGMAVRLTGGLHLTGDWVRYDLPSSHSDVFSVGVKFQFGR